MLVIDENMFKLAKMQETLLKVSNTNRMENLNNYKKTVIEIDTKAFADILEKIKNLNEYSHSLEEELEFLQRIKDTYDQLLELQSSFKRVCETYGDKNLKLSDLSELNIEYIENRISAINGYLMNIKNIETNKTKLQELSEQLVVEEKKKEVLENRLKNLEESLKYNFINAEGRNVTNSNHSTSIITEYKDLNLDFTELLGDNIAIDKLLSEANVTVNEAEMTFKATRICFELTPNPENRTFLEENNKSLLKAKYRLIMLEMLKLLSQNYSDYDSCKMKREQLLILIEERKKHLKLLGVHLSIDPFDRAKVKEQLNAIMSMTDSSKTINNTRKKISDLTTRIEEMSNQNSSYLILLNDTKSLIESKTSINDIDITDVQLPIEEIPKKKDVAKNQVVQIRTISSKLNMSIVSQKTASVIKRVYQMISRKNERQLEPKKEFVPELVVIPSSSKEMPKEQNFEDTIFDESFLVTPEILDTTPYIDEREYLEEPDEPKEIETTQSIEDYRPSLDLADIFETVNPFEEPVLFSGKSDDDIPNIKTESESLPIIELDKKEETTNNDFELPFIPSNETTSDAFWPTQEEIVTSQEESEEQKLTFDDQIQMLILPEENNSKIRKKVA